MANEPVRLTFPRIYELLMSKAKKILRLTHLEDRAFFDKILPRLSEEQKKDLNITNLNGFLNHEVDPKSAEIGLRDLDSPKGYGNFYYGKCKIAYILQSLSIIAESTSRYLSYVNYGTRNSLNKMIDILTNNNIGMNNQKIGAFGTSKAQTEFKAFFSTIKSFVSWFKTGYNFDERNGDKHSAAFLECFHKQYYDSRWVQINPQNGLLLQWEDGMYFKEGIKPERSNIFSAWEYLTMESTIMINSKQYTGRTYEIFGHAEMPSEVFKAFVQIYTKTRKPIEQIFPTNSFEWREFLINMDLIPSAKALRPLMLKNLKIMRYYVNSWMDNYSLQHPQKNSPKNPDFTYTTHSGYYVLHRFVHNLAQLSENDIPLFTHIRRYTEPHSSNLNFLYGTEVALYQMFLDFISLIYGLDMAKGRIVIQKLIDKIRYFAQNPDSAFKRTATSYIPPYPDSLIEPNKQVSIFSVHKNRLDNIAVTQPIPNLIIDGLSIFSEFKRTNASEFIIKSSNEIKGIEFNKKISKIDSALESDLFIEIFEQFGEKKTQDIENTQKFEIHNPLYLPILSTIFGENKIIGFQSFQGEYRPKITRRKRKSKYDAIDSMKKELFHKAKRAVHSRIVYGMEPITVPEGIMNFGVLMDDIVRLYKWPTRPGDNNMREISRASESYSKIIPTKNGEYVQLRDKSNSISHDFCLGGIFFEISEYLQTEMGYGDPTQGLLYIGNKIYTIKISSTRGRPVCFIVKNLDVQTEYIREFENLGMKVPVINKDNFIIWIRMIKGYIDLISQENSIEKSLKIVQNLDLLKIFNPSSKKMLHITNKNTNSVQKLFHFIFQEERDKNFQEWKQNFLDYFFKGVNNTKYCDKFMLYYDLGKIENLEKNKRELEFQYVLQSHGLKSLEITYQLISPSNKYFALRTDSNNYGDFVVTEDNKALLLNEGEEEHIEDTSISYSYKLEIRRYRIWKKLPYAQFLQTII